MKTMLRISKWNDGVHDPMYEVHVGQEDSINIAENRWKDTPNKEWISDPFTEAELHNAYWV